MRIVIAIIITFFISICQAKDSHHATPHRIRVNTENDPLSNGQFTTELNIYQGSTYYNMFLEYETEDQLKIGVYFNNMPIQVGNYTQTYSYDSYIGISKWFKLSTDFKLGFGSQSGTQLKGSPKNYLNFEFLQLQYKIMPNFYIGLGAYYANTSLTTTNTNFGSMISLYYEFIPHTLWAEFDWYSGETNISGSILNTYYKMNKFSNVYVGIQIPASNSGNEFAGNIGLILQF